MATQVSDKEIFEVESPAEELPLALDPSQPTTPLQKVPDLATIAEQSQQSRREVAILSPIQELALIYHASKKSMPGRNASEENNFAPSLADEVTRAARETDPSAKPRPLYRISKRGCGSEDSDDEREFELRSFRRRMIKQLKDRRSLKKMRQLARVQEPEWQPALSLEWHDLSGEEFQLFRRPV